ncbi:dimeric dihydrodiol dehydrogenase [Penicillium cosmopolitanum]|uniref:D-xylose 1-dehydrogenase (NADP(+), D-xylono-1,5-lactone-forming) n=1 Tax=Penicillium cosmopolitanum TaxID=1131564 RepID=A0A9X0BD64_9EURO|nr:dimeric dihydrodiol dehydrogenase [Penicillium cosmopolitanum]KAJ5408255.1 dimeric dihydrodiol dehydrogenase [Penicillium cosmopolitanum]
MTNNELPALRWGIVGTGLISSWFVADLTIDRANRGANHTIQAIGSSSVQKGQEFASQHLSGHTPTIYGSYAELYNDPNVEIVYIGTPHAFHKQNALDAIRAGKHVLCEKSFTLNEREAKEVFAEARGYNVFIMEAMWTRFFPLVQKLRQLIHVDKTIGDVHRVWCDFGLPKDIASLPITSRYKDPALGAGSLLDIGIYSLTWVILALESNLRTETPQVLATQKIVHHVDVATSVLLNYPDGRQGVATSTFASKTPANFCRIEGTIGSIVVEGLAASVPTSFTIQLRNEEPQKYEFERPGRGFYWEADAVAIDIAAGKTENDIMPCDETIRIMHLLDEIRRQGGAQFPQDLE